MLRPFPGYEEFEAQRISLFNRNFNHFVELLSYAEALAEWSAGYCSFRFFSSVVTSQKSVITRPENSAVSPVASNKNEQGTMLVAVVVNTGSFNLKLQDLEQSDAIEHFPETHPLGFAESRAMLLPPENIRDKLLAGMFIQHPLSNELIDYF